MIGVGKSAQFSDFVDFQYSVCEKKLGFFNTGVYYVLTGSYSVVFYKKLSEISGLPFVLTSVDESLYDELQGKIDNLFPLNLQKKYFL